MTDIKEQKVGWKFDNSYTNLPTSFFSYINLNPVHSPELVILNKPLATSLGLNAEIMDSQEVVGVLAGNKIPEGGIALAQAYAGHQFGHPNMLGDGRALLIGEQMTPDGKRVDIQLKGSGRTPYSRGGDGRATLGPMLREYIISEAMHALGIPTTRSLAVVSTGEIVYRETELPGAILTRVAASHIRVGTFQYAAGRGEIDDLKRLADYTINRHYPHIEAEENRYLSLLLEVMKKQAELIAKWQLVGFIHGVMNTDNMTISGETIDYGPCAFMDTYDPATVFSSIDREGRYAYGNQPYIASWNLARFAETLLPLMHENEEEAIKLAQHAIESFTKMYHMHWFIGMRAKLGLFNEELSDETLIDNLLTMMKKYEEDFTNTFRNLTLGKQEDTELYKSAEFKKWYEMWQARLERQEETKEDALELMKKNNPFVIPRNHKVEEALKAAVEKEDYTVMEKLLNVLQNPYDYTVEDIAYCKPADSSDGPYRTYCGT